MSENEQKTRSESQSPNPKKIRRVAVKSTSKPPRFLARNTYHDDDGNFELQNDSNDYNKCTYMANSFDDIFPSGRTTLDSDESSNSHSENSDSEDQNPNDDTSISGSESENNSNLIPENEISDSEQSLSSLSEDSNGTTEDSNRALKYLKYIEKSRVPQEPVPIISKSHYNSNENQIEINSDSDLNEPGTEMLKIKPDISTISNDYNKYLTDTFDNIFPTYYEHTTSISSIDMKNSDSENQNSTVSVQNSKKKLSSILPQNNLHQTSEQATSSKDCNDAKRNLHKRTSAESEQNYEYLKFVKKLRDRQQYVRPGPSRSNSYQNPNVNQIKGKSNSKDEPEILNTIPENIEIRENTGILSKSDEIRKLKLEIANIKYNQKREISNKILVALEKKNFDIRRKNTKISNLKLEIKNMNNKHRKEAERASCLNKKERENFKLKMEKMKTGLKTEHEKEIADLKVKFELQSENNRKLERKLTQNAEETRRRNLALAQLQAKNQVVNSVTNEFQAFLAQTLSNLLPEEIEVDEH